MNVLVACEESQIVCEEFRKRGHMAFSCDIIEPSGNHPEWHIKSDVLPLLNGECSFKTMDGRRYNLWNKWDMILAFPPCTYLTIAGNRWFNVEKYGEKAIQREKERRKAIEFFMKFVNADCNKIAIENPIGVMSSVYQKPTQIIHPWMFGHNASKNTCLWLKNLKKLRPTNIVEDTEKWVENQFVDENGNLKGFMTRDENGKLLRYSDPKIKRIRSKTFTGVAKAMAEQWG